MAITKLVNKHQYGGNGQCASDLACLDHVHAIGSWQPDWSGNLSCIGLRTANLSQVAGREDIGRVQDGIHAGHVVNKGFDVAAGISSFFDAFTYRSFVERFTSLCSPAGNFEGRSPSEKPILTDKQYFFISHRNEPDSRSVIIYEECFPLITDTRIDSKDALITVSIFKALFQNCGFGHFSGSLEGSYLFLVRDAAGHAARFRTTTTPGSLIILKSKARIDC